MIIALIFCTVVLSFWLYYKDLNKIAKQFSGPQPLPIVGNALTLYCKNEEVLEKSYQLFREINLDSSGAARFWLGPRLLIIFQNVHYVEAVLCSKKFAYKSDLYDLVKIYLGEGLVSASGPRHKMHRRIIQPMLNKQFSEAIIPVLQKNIEICMKKLDEYIDKSTFDIHYTLERAIMDSVGEMFLGYNLSAQESDKNKPFFQSIIDMYDLGFTRIIKPWLHSDFLFQYSPYKKSQDQICYNLHTYVKEFIKSSRKRLKSTENLKKDYQAIIDQIAEYIEQNPESFTEEEFISHMITLYAASEDTLTIITSFTAVCLGMYPECQVKVAEEIRSVFGETPRPVTIDDIKLLPYLDMCIKEAMRIVPVATFIVRQCKEECTVGPYKVNPDCNIMIPIYNIHRDPKHWEKPLEFYPEHFLSETVNKRHIFAYIPFSAGPRGCVGKTIANVGLKILLANLLQRYQFEADGKLPNLKLRTDISTRPLHGYRLRLKKRVWAKL